MGASVLIADDSAYMRRLLRACLRDDHEVVGAAENGVEVVERHGQVGADVVLLDAVMPIQDGVTATAEIREADPGVAVVVTSTVDQSEARRRATEAGADEHVVKPFQRSGLLRAIDDAVPAD